MDGNRVVRRGICATAVAAVLFVAGCGGSSDPSSDPTGSSPSSSPSSSPAESPSESTSSTPTVEPATGPLLDMSALSVRAPEKWQLQKQIVDFAIDAKSPGSATGVQLTDLRALGDATLQELAKSAIKDYSDVRRVKVLDTVTIDGVECYHVTGGISRLDQFDDFGAIHDGRQVNLHFIFATSDFTPAERQQIIDSVLATWTWK